MSLADWKALAANRGNAADWSTAALLLNIGWAVGLASGLADDLTDGPAAMFAAVSASGAVGRRMNCSWPLTATVSLLRCCTTCSWPLTPAGLSAAHTEPQKTSAASFKPSRHAGHLIRPGSGLSAPRRNRR